MRLKREETILVKMEKEEDISATVMDIPARMKKDQKTKYPSSKEGRKYVSKSEDHINDDE